MGVQAFYAVGKSVVWHSFISCKLFGMRFAVCYLFKKGHFIEITWKFWPLRSFNSTEVVLKSVLRPTPGPIIYLLGLPASTLFQPLYNTLKRMNTAGMGALQSTYSGLADAPLK